MTLPTTSPTEGLAQASREEILSALFMDLVSHLATSALLMLGLFPDPQAHHTVQDLPTAKIFIDQLEMLQAKTQGNLTSEEDSLLRKTLDHLHKALGEALDQQAHASSLPSAGEA